MDNMINLNDQQTVLAQLSPEQQELVKRLLAEAEEVGKNKVLEARKNTGVKQSLGSFLHDYVLYQDNDLIARFRLIVASIIKLYPQVVEESKSLQDSLNVYDDIELLKIAPWCITAVKEYGWQFRDTKGRLTELLESIKPKENKKESEESEESEGLLTHLPSIEESKDDKILDVASIQDVVPETSKNGKKVTK